jgi:hypothetical protein
VTYRVPRVVARLQVLLPGCDDRLLAVYAVLVLTRGVLTTSEDVHDAWNVVTYQRRPNHRSLVPYEALAGPVQRLDDKYTAAIRQVAKEESTWS